MIKTQHEYAHGWQAHLLRRVVHLSSLLILWIYYQYGAAAARICDLTLPQLIYVCLAVIICLEIVRLWRGWTVFGQRSYERKHLSAFAWGACSMGIVLLFAPGKEFAIPIIIAYAVGDPLLGELRRTPLSKIVIILIGVLAVAGIWAVCSLIWGTPLWLALPMAVITVAAEWPCLKWIDDNALMQLIPLIAILIISSLM